LALAVAVVAGTPVFAQGAAAEAAGGGMSLAFFGAAIGLGMVVIGAGIGILFVYAIEDRPLAAIVLAGAALGAVLAVAVRQAVGAR